jgi:hypothetical protein
MSKISVSIVRPEAVEDVHWRDLSPFSRNVFMHPTALRAASETMIAVVYVMLAWDVGVEPQRLVGLWAVQARQFLFWPFLETLPFNYAFLATPVLHPDHAGEIMPAFLAALQRQRDLPDTLLVRDLDADGREYAAVERALSGRPRLLLKTDQRPVAAREAGIKRSGSTRKKLRQDWNKLAAAGEIAVVNVRDPAAIGEALKSFLDMEVKGWKGAGGTAILSNSADASFARRLIGDLAVLGKASVALLRLDGRPIAAQVLLYEGRTAYTWKTSFDPEYGRYSAGTLLVDRITTDLLDEGVVDTIDSCSRGDGFMAQLWSARKPMVDMVASAAGRSPAFVAISGYFWAREALKSLRDRWRRRRRRARADATPTAPAPTRRDRTKAATAPSGLEASARKSTADHPA